MTLEELKKTGKNGVYRSDMDEWFIEGEEPPLLEPGKTESAALLEPTPELQSSEEPAASAAPVKPSKGGKQHE